ncbi:hypothetical protein BD769DRAFT_1395795 [Suillus cothurnatus]|nr:hypothetical protein BD769DRAFT_1395795 [Suillus cothurnatus]
MTDKTVAQMRTAGIPLEGLSPFDGIIVHNPDLTLQSNGTILMCNHAYCDFTTDPVRPVLTLVKGCVATTVNSNTDVTIMHSLKIAWPLLTNMAYFVVFAVVLFSIIGIQSFNGSF